jgi:hypothetical protein
MLYPAELQARQEGTIHQPMIHRPRRSFSLRSRRAARIVSIAAQGDVEGVMMTTAVRAAAAAEPADSL